MILTFNWIFLFAFFKKNQQYNKKIISEIECTFQIAVCHGEGYSNDNKINKNQMNGDADINKKDDLKKFIEGYFYKNVNGYIRYTFDEKEKEIEATKLTDTQIWEMKYHGENPYSCLKKANELFKIGEKKRFVLLLLFLEKKKDFDTSNSKLMKIFTEMERKGFVFQIFGNLENDELKLKEKNIELKNHNNKIEIPRNIYNFNDNLDTIKKNIVKNMQNIKNRYICNYRKPCFNIQQLQNVNKESLKKCIGLEHRFDCEYKCKKNFVPNGIICLDGVFISHYLQGINVGCVDKCVQAPLLTKESGIKYFVNCDNTPFGQKCLFQCDENEIVSGEIICKLVKEKNGESVWKWIFTENPSCVAKPEIPENPEIPEESNENAEESTEDAGTITENPEESNENAGTSAENAEESTEDAGTITENPEESNENAEESNENAEESNENEETICAKIPGSFPNVQPKSLEKCAAKGQNLECEFDCLKEYTPTGTIICRSNGLWDTKNAFCFDKKIKKHGDKCIHLVLALFLLALYVVSFMISREKKKEIDESSLLEFALSEMSDIDIEAKLIDPEIHLG